MRRARLLTTVLVMAMGAAGAARARENPPRRVVELPGEVLRDKIRGGLLGQILGNLNGLEHENAYIDEPGDVRDYTPALPEGAHTDDDTDLEWVYIVAMQDEDQILLPPSRIAWLWREHINEGIWCSNRYARHLMDLGLEPPLTGSQVLNPWAEFNISGQFLSETFGLIAPALPRTASRIGLNYTRVAIDAEPAQTTQLFCSMIACAFETSDLEDLLDAGVAALDPASRIRKIVADVRRWHEQHPDDWRTTRRLLKERYTQAGGAMRDRNGYDLMTGSTIAALLYGGGDLAETLRLAFNFGWDADNSAATAGAVVGTVVGYRSMMARGWRIVDRYRNTTRDGMPDDETITSFADRLVELAERVMAEQGGERVLVHGGPVYRIRSESPGSVYPLVDPETERARMRANLEAPIQSWVRSPESDQDRARAAYLAICLDLADELAAESPGEWQGALEALRGYPRVLGNLYDREPGTPGQRALQARARGAGLEPPAEFTVGSDPNVNSIEGRRGAGLSPGACSGAPCRRRWPPAGSPRRAWGWGPSSAGAPRASRGR
jgi:hypothetical protein